MENLINRVKALDAGTGQRDELVVQLQASVVKGDDVVALTRAYDAAERARKLLGDWLTSPLREELAAELEATLQRMAGDVGNVWKRRMASVVEKGGGRTKVIAVGVGVFVIVVFLGAGLPLLLNALKSKRDESTAAASVADAVGSHIRAKEDGLESRTAMRGTNLVMTPGLKDATASVVTYTIALRIGGSGDIDKTDDMLVMQRTPSTDSNATFSVFANPRTRQLKVYQKKKVSGNCVFVINDLPLYKWCVVHVVFNNMPLYQTTHVFIDGKLLKVGNHNTCESGVANQSGDTIRFGPKTMLEVQYFKAVPRTLMQDEIKTEAAAIVADINQFYMDQLMLQMRCAL